MLANIDWSLFFSIIRTKNHHKYKSHPAVLSAVHAFANVKMVTIWVSLIALAFKPG